LGETEAQSSKEVRISLGLFLLTLGSVYLTYGWLWSEGSPLSDPQTMVDSAVFSVALMAILGAHELAHYWVARRHGFALSLPYFIPFPFAFGTLGAVIRLRSLPKSRTALLEMGAAGPIAGAVLALACIAVGLHGTLPVAAPPLVDEGMDILIFGNPPIMDQLGVWVLGEAPGRYDVLTPLALAGWVGCFLTALNLLPIGQLDGGHILTGLSPRWAPLLSKWMLGLLLLAGFLFWEGWAVWAVLLLVMGAWENLEVPQTPGLTRRARWVAAVSVLFFFLCFMPQPIETETVAPEQAPSIEVLP
jgi:membrane-associated protease RseP (regulator of RpoE activity)